MREACFCKPFSEIKQIFLWAGDYHPPKTDEFNSSELFEIIQNDNNIIHGTMYGIV